MTPEIAATLDAARREHGPGVMPYPYTARLQMDRADHSESGEFEIRGVLLAVPAADGFPADEDARAILREKTVPPDGYVLPVRILSCEIGACLVVAS